MKKTAGLSFIFILCIGGLSGCASENTPVLSQSVSEQEEPTSSVETDDVPGHSSDVYMTEDISAAGLVNIYEALEASPSGKIAVKLSTGEPGSN